MYSYLDYLYIATVPVTFWFDFLTFIYLKNTPLFLKGDVAFSTSHFHAFLRFFTLAQVKKSKLWNFWCYYPSQWMVLQYNKHEEWKAFGFTKLTLFIVMENPLYEYLIP